MSLLALDSEDKIYLSELHNNEFEILKNNFGQDKRVTIEKKDAYASLDQMITSYEGTRLVLIDPSYEVKNEYEKVAKLIRHNFKQFPGVCFLGGVAGLGMRARGRRRRKWCERWGGAQHVPLRAAHAG